MENFIRTSKEDNIKNFFMNDIDELLKKYEPGEPKMKPDVLIQIKQIELEREKMVNDSNAEMNKNAPRIMMERPGQPPISLSIEDVVNLLKQQQGHIEFTTRRVQELETSLQSLQMLLLNKSRENMNLQKEIVELKDKISVINSLKNMNTRTINDVTLTPTPPGVANVYSPSTGNIVEKKHSLSNGNTTNKQQNIDLNANLYGGDLTIFNLGSKSKPEVKVEIY